jgi:hypothetical protein
LNRKVAAGRPGLPGTTRLDWPLPSTLSTLGMPTPLDVA